MTKETYLRVTGRIRGDMRKIRLVKFVNRILTGFVFLLYPALLLMLFLEKNPFFLRAVLVPAISFLAVSLFRRAVNAPRPYEKFETPPVLEKDTKGKSFPSRHVFSVFVIGMTVFYLYHGAGLMLFAVGAGVGAIRVVGGVHEPRDIIAGAAAGVISGILGFYVL